MTRGYKDEADAIIEFLTDWPYRYITIRVLKENVDERYRNHLANATRWIIAAWDQRVIRYYDGAGTYEVIDLDAYFDTQPDPGVTERWNKRYTR